MLRAVALSLRQFADPAFLRVFAQSLALTALVFGVLAGLAGWGAERAMLAALGWTSAGLASLVAAGATVLAGWLLFRAVAMAVIGLFGDAIVVAVEARHYPPALARARPVPFGRALAMGIGSALRVVAVNVVLAPLYVALLVTGVGTFLAVLLVNGWLLGRDLGDMVAARHMPAAALRGWRAASRGRRLALGLAVAGLFVVPGLNLLAPVLGAAMATHLFHRSWRA